jgi:DNA-binding SARP family transcriptional activator/DNA-binding beta-propeller fold protein YncE
VLARRLGDRPAARYKERVEFRILGPLEVADGRGLISFDAPKQRTLLSVLLLHPNEVVPSERLIDELWGERPPATATKVVQSYVSQLRRALGPDVIVTRSPGYELRVEEDALDVERFRQLTSEGRGLAAKGEQARADALFREALALWRGPPLADVVFESFARNQVERLEEERLGALVNRIDCEVALGRHDRLVPELEQLIRQYPLRERLRAQLMLALYRSGRQADALAAYQDARRVLVDELGLEPSAELQHLERAILTHDPALEAPAPPKPDAVGNAGRLPGKLVALGRRHRRAALALAALLLLAGAVGLAFAFDRARTASTLLVPNSVGFIDAKSGRMTRSFSVGREPRAITIAASSVWVANYEDETVTRIDRATGAPVTIPVGGHPTGLTTRRGDVWVWTLEGQLTEIDPRFNVSTPLQLGPRIARLIAPIRGVSPAQIHRQVGDGKITSGGGFLWVTVPLTTVIRIDPAEPRRARVIVPNDGVQGAIAYREGAVWVAGYREVFPIEASTPRIPRSGIVVGLASSLTFGDGSLWVVSGGQMDQGVVPALRRLDLHGHLVEATINVGSDPIAAASAGGSVWVASRGDRAIRRVEPARDQVVNTIQLGGQPSALAADADGVWVAVG